VESDERPLKPPSILLNFVVRCPLIPGQIDNGHGKTIRASNGCSGHGQFPGAKHHLDQIQDEEGNQRRVFSESPTPISEIRGDEINGRAPKGRRRFLQEERAVIVTAAADAVSEMKRMINVRRIETLVEIV